MHAYRSFVVAVLLFLALGAIVAFSPAAAMAPGYECPAPAAYPKSVLAELLPATAAFTGTVTVEGYVMVDATGNFDFVKVANITGTFLQSYRRDLGTYFSEYYIDIADTPTLVLNITFTLLTSDKLSRYNEYCMTFNPPAAVPYYVQNLQGSDQFFSGTYYHTRNGGTGTFGDVAENEYFFLDEQKINSINCLTAFNADASIKTLTCFKFHKTSNKPIPPCGAAGVGVGKRSIEDYDSVVKVGHYYMPAEVIAPEYRALFA